VKILEDICVYKFVYESNTVSFNKLALACKQPFTGNYYFLPCWKKWYPLPFRHEKGDPHTLCPPLNFLYSLYPPLNPSKVTIKCNTD
jgi:hypothetical protein